MAAPLRIAAEHLVREALVARADETTQALRDRLIAGIGYQNGTANVLDAEGRLAGVVPLERLLTAREGAVGDIMDPAPPSASNTDDQERVATIAVRHGLSAVPVCDHAGRFLGVVPPTALVAILRHEHLEDLSRLAGMDHEADAALQAMSSAPLRRARLRLPWLLVGLAGAMVTTGLMAGFERQLDHHLEAAFFVPGLVYLADAIGTQSEAIAVRGLSVHQVAPVWHLLIGEVATGVLLGLALAAVALPAAWLAFGDGTLAIAVGVSVVAAGTVASAVGLGFPWLLHALGTDPAFGAGPMGTIVQDLLTLVIFLVTIQLAL